MKKELQTITFN